MEKSINSALPAEWTRARRALVCGIDLTGFTRWVDDQVEQQGADGLEAIADDLSAFLGGASAILAAEEFTLGSLLGDGLLAFRTGPAADWSAAEARIRRGLLELEPTARVGFGAGPVERRVFAGLSGTTHAVIAGGGVRQCYRDLANGRRASVTRRSPPPVCPSLARFATAEIRHAAIGFLAFRAYSLGRLGHFVDDSLAIWQARALASGGTLERLSYDDDALLVRFGWPGDAVAQAWVENFLEEQAAMRPARVSAGWGAGRGPVFQARLAGVTTLTGADLDVAQGPAINHAAKSAKRMLEFAAKAPQRTRPAASPTIAPSSRLVGRDAEIAWVNGRIAAGRRVVMICGEAGIGKSSLLTLASAERAADALLSMTGKPGDVLEPLGPWRAVVALDRNAQVDIQFASAKAQVLTRAAQRPLLIVVDDLQWTDTYSQKLLDELAGSDAALSILAAGRPGAEKCLTALEPEDILQLSGMGAAEIDAIARPLCGPPPPSLATIAGGNPFLAVQLALDWRDRKGEGSQVESQSAVIDMRLAQLAPSSLSALRLLAILDRPTDNVVLESVCREAGLEFDSAAPAVLCQRKLLEPGDGPGTLRIAHRLIQERVVGQIPPSSILRISAVVARLLRGRLDDAPALGVVGEHLRNARQWQRAAVSDFADAERALAIHAHRSAAELFARAGDGFRRVGASTDRIDLAEAGAGLAAWGIGDVTAAADAAARRRAIPAGSTPWRTRAQVATAILTGRPHFLAPRLALTLVRRAALRSELGYFSGKLSDIMFGGLVVARLSDDREATQISRTRSLGLLALGLGLVGLRKPARATFARCQRAGGDRLPAAYAFCAEALYHMAQGSWDEGERCIASSEARLGEPRDAHLYGALLCVRGLSLHMRGLEEQAIAAFEALSVLARRRANRQFEAWALYGGAMPRIALGQFTKAKQQVGAATELMTGNGDLLSRLNCAALDAQLAWLDGDAASAITSAKTCLEISRTIFPANFGSLDGFTLPALVLADIVRSRSADSALLIRAEKLLPAALAGSRRFAARCPIGAPRLASAQAMLARNEGIRCSHQARALALSQRLGMPHPYPRSNPAGSLRDSELTT